MIGANTPKKLLNFGQFHSNGLMLLKCFENPNVSVDNSVSYFTQHLPSMLSVDANHFVNLPLCFVNNLVDDKIDKVIGTINMMPLLVEEYSCD